jgi:hypothetical protein
MARSKNALSLAKSSLLHLALVPAVLAAVPLVALFMVAARLLLPVLLVLGTIALVASPTFRRLLGGNLGDRQSW